MKTIKKSTEKSLINQFILNFERDTLQKKNKNKRFSFVLTGGKSPLNLYKKLAKSQVDWQNIDLFWGDERYVSQKNKNSNYKLAYDNLIKKIKINKNSVFRINTNNKVISNSSRNYSNQIKKYFMNKVISFDYFLLGMGEDGHIASIFPNSKEIKKKFIVKPVFRKDFIRITLSLNVINNSMKIILWLNNKLKTTKYKQLKLLGKEIPVNNLDKRKTFVFRIS
jgi:6-phosphogluconolactonase